MRPGLFTFLLLASFLSGACATLPSLPREIPPAQEVLREVLARREAVQGLKGLALVEVSSPDKSFRSQQVLFARRPGFLRVETLGPLGTPVLYAVSDGGSLVLYFPGENRYYQGVFHRRALSFALPLELSPDEWVAFLLGGVPVSDRAGVSLRPDRSEGLWVLELASSAPEEKQTLWVHPESFLLLRAELKRPDGSYQLVFSGFHPIKGVPFAHRMEITSGDRKTRVSVEFPEVDLNPPWEAADFSLPVPRGAAILPLP